MRVGRTASARFFFLCDRTLVFFAEELSFRATAVRRTAIGRDAMPLLHWNDEYVLGVYVYDNEHQQLMALVNTLYDAIVEGNSHAIVLSVLQKASLFAEKHFAHEEEFFEISGYANAAAHRREHAQLMAQLHAFSGIVDETQESVIDIKLSLFLASWFKDHTLNMDREFCAHLRDKGVH